MATIELKPEFAIPFDAPIKARNRETYASFGEDGLTATANAHGHLIQITRYFGNEPSRFICVDLPEAPAPYYVTDRMKQLQKSCESSHVGMRIQLPEQLDNENQELVDELNWGVGKDIPRIQFYQDRWPCFITKNPWLDSEVQYFLSSKTVYQTYTFSAVEGMENVFPKEFPQIMISANLLLRHLDFATEESPWNTWNDHKHDQNNAEDNYIHGSTPNEKTIFIKHKDCETGRDGKKDAILFISPYIDDRSQSVGHIGQSVNYEIKIDEQAKKDLAENKLVKITLAYALELVSSAGDVSSTLSEGVLLPLQPKHNAYQPPLFTDDKHLNFALRRNFEHILSVCSIPIPMRDEPEEEIIPIALTCGDISGHRVAKEASFYAFQFLLKAFEHFDNSGLKDSEGQRLSDHPLDLAHAFCKNNHCQMRFRIWKTCLGHLAWIGNHMNTEYTISSITRDGTIDQIKEQGSVNPHYWASGEVIYGWEENPSVFLDREITDAPMQIIKFGEFRRITGHGTILRNVDAGLKSIAEHWVKSLHEQNRTGAYAFPRIKREQPRKFYLADHALVWWASKSLEELGLESVLEAQPDNSADASRQRIMKYSSDEIKANIIKRFTEENYVSRTRMIAISRSSAETRFSIFIRDTVIFYAMDLGLFDVEAAEESTSTNEANEALTDIWDNKIDEWANTVDYQARREDQHFTHWDHPLQFALSIIMSAKDKSTNSRLASRMFKYSRLILLESSSPNGLFPGQLDIYKKPVLFEREIMRDTYWQATFEVPFILWKCCKSPVLGGEPSIESISSDIIGLENIIRLLPSMNGNEMPNNSFNEEKIVNIPDEWLYNELDCFENSIGLSEIKIRRLSEAYQSMTQIAIMSEAAQTIQNGPHRESEERILGYIIDVPQTSNRSWDTFISTPINSNMSLFARVSLKRTPTNAKKRLLHFCRATDKTASLCYISAFEHPDIYTFFERHKAYSKFFQEETNAVLNLWVTEFHMSFYQIISGNHPPHITSIPGFDHYDFPLSTTEKGGNLKQISRVVMSFRFDGDFFDRHWTCHFFEFNPYRIDANRMTDISEERITGSLKADPWKQRRVLELVLFGKILQEMILCSQGILDEIKGRILESFKNGPSKPRSSSTFLDSIDLFGEITSNMFLSTNKSWNIFQYILQVVEEDLGDNLSKIELWMRREERPDKPQWTSNDERNYQGAIYRLQKSNDRLVQDLRLCYTRAKSFNASLTRRLESTRGEWEVGSNDDIRLFTYVTVVFLPISFATGVFSMSSTPAKETLNSMMTTAGLALLATVVALLYAKALYSKVVRPFFAALRLALRIPIYLLGLAFRLVHLVLISLLSFLPGKCIYLLRSCLISPTGESSPRPYNVAYQAKNSFDQKIGEKLQKIQEKLARAKQAEKAKLAQRKQRQEDIRRKREAEMV
ncbi:hypothetical protein H0G86_009609 [Trichoderma simmonsii]|uniref:Uncharacterized protein n=1 Tax=Trichoderma simmonsii TaxID=1491479 RepID=A0A8G0PJ92_9HYPO|nr:hypothetical protein H0G86_009609 [Trichoderma simmonsii]